LSRRKKIAVLGATGSVGRQALEVLMAFADQFEVVGLAANENSSQMAELVKRHKPRLVAMASSQAADQLRNLLDDDDRVEIIAGPDSLTDMACDPEVELVLAAVVGRAGLAPTFAAVQAGKTVALANKESLVMAGELVMKEARARQVEILPVDSEHAAAHQLLASVERDQVNKIVITASGGPFFGCSRQELSQVSAQQALAHPKWDMGAKISIDSATMMNKGFEVIEARWLFDLAPEQIGVLVHPQSLVHAILETIDGSAVCQMAVPDMRGPIAYALGYPNRLNLRKRLENFEPLDLLLLNQAGFHQAHENDYPALALCRQALEQGGGAAAALSVADEVVVAAFLEGRIGFNEITDILKGTMDRFQNAPIASITDVLQAGEQGASLANALVDESKPS
jgi:1-deoxy-D-xylulose-5-phosphate reductoisomerase